MPVVERKRRPYNRRENWTQEEIEKLADLVFEHGLDYVKISERLDRSRKQVFQKINWIKSEKSK